MSSSAIGHGSTTSTTKINKNIKPWLDPQRTLASRVDALLDSPWIHAAEFRVDSELHVLLLKCCRLQSLPGLQMAQQIMERLLLEKTRLNAQQQEQSYTTPSATTATSSDDTFVVDVCIPERFWQNVIFGWSKLAGKLRVTRRHMKDNLVSAIEAAKSDWTRRKSRDQAAAVHKDGAVHSGGGDSDRLRNSSEPTLEIFNTFLLGLSRVAKQEPGAAMQAEQTLFDMMEYHEKFGWHTKPTTKSYSLVINAHVNSRHKTADYRALAILNHVKQLHETEKLQYMDRFGIAYHERGPNHPRIVTPDGHMYTSVMMTMLNSRMRSRRVVELLHEFLDFAKKSNDNETTMQVDSSHFILPIRALGNEIDHINNAARRVKLAEEAEAILNLMFEYMAQKKQQVTTIDNTSKQQHDGEHQQQREEGDPFQKAIYAFNACLDAWSRAYAKEAVLRCEDLLKKMLDKSINTSTSASASTMTDTASSNGNHNNEEVVAAVSTAGHDVVVQPDTVSFNACLQAWSMAHSFYPGAAYRTNELLDLFRQLHTSGLVKKGPDMQSWTITILALQHVTPTKSRRGGDNDDDIKDNNTATLPASGASIVRRARRLLEEMLDSVQNQSTQISRNLAGPFTAVIRVAAKMAESVTDESTSRGQNEKAFAKESTVSGRDASTVDDSSLLFGEHVDNEGRHEDEDVDEADLMDPYTIACRTYREAVDDLYDLKDRQRAKNSVEQNYNDNYSDSSNNVSIDSSDNTGAGGIADHHTFAAMLTCIDRYNPHPTSSERKTFGDAVFTDACQAGQVSRAVLHEAAVVLQIPAAMEVVVNSKSNGGKNEIPRFWYRNVEGSWRPK
jgi:hypothetical protein